MTHKTVVYGDTEYMITMLPPSRAIKLLTKLTKIVGEPMAKMAAAAGDQKDEMIPMAIAALTSKLEAEEVLALVKELMTCVTKDNKSINFETEFMGKLGTVLKLCKEVLEVNYSDFLEEISSLMS